MPQVSLEEERARQAAAAAEGGGAAAEGAAAAAAGGEAAAPAAGAGGDDMDMDEDAVLQRALAMSMAVSGEVWGGRGWGGVFWERGGGIHLLMPPARKLAHLALSATTVAYEQQSSQLAS